MSPRLAMRLFLLLPAVGCVSVPPPDSEQLSSFAVEATGVFTATPIRQPLDVTTPCAKSYGGQAQVPAEVRGTTGCPYQIPRGEVELDLTAYARDRDAQPLNDYFGSVSFRVVPGDLTGGYPFRWAPVKEGVATGTVKVSHLFGEVRVWAEDAPPKLDYADGGIAGDINELPLEPARRSFATGISPPIIFEDPSLAKVQEPDGFDNRSSPLVGQFLTIGRNPAEGAFTQSCADDPERDGQPVTMVVTGTDQTGFYVTDVTACRLKEELKDQSGTTQVRVPEPDGMLPGTYGSIFVYNFSYPEGLYAGDLLFTLAGSVQEFTSTTQLVFPSWTIGEQVRLLPETQRDKWLGLVTIKDLNLRICGLDDTADPFITDTMCGHNRRNLKLESLESSLVRVRRIRMPRAFTSCDFDANKEVPFFCETKEGPDWVWGNCGAVDESSVLTQERACHVDCVVGQGEWTGEICSERTTLQTFGQYAIELAGPGPAEAGLDDSLPNRTEALTLTASSVRSQRSHPVGSDVRVYCSAPVHYRFGGSTVVAEATDPVLPAHTLLDHRVTTSGGVAAFLGQGTTPGSAKCWVARNVSVKLNLITKDAVPDLQVDCRIDDPDPDLAERCTQLRAASFDVIGHLRHLQPGRPRWVLQPRDVDDLCCHPGPGLSCPKPIKPCP